MDLNDFNKGREDGVNYLYGCETFHNEKVVRLSDAEALEARLAAAESSLREAREALRLLLTEVEESGNGNAKDFGWPRALKCAREVLGDGPFNPLGVQIIAVPIDDLAAEQAARAALAAKGEG